MLAYHFDLVGVTYGLYCADGVHLSDIGLGIINLNLLTCIELEVGVLLTGGMQIHCTCWLGTGNISLKLK